MNIYNVTDFDNDIQKAIDKCFLNGGGEVVIPTGDYSVSTIRIRSNVNLHLLKDTHLIASRNPRDYDIVLNDVIEPIKEFDKTDALWLPVAERNNADHINKCAGKWNNAIIKAIDAENIRIIGEKGSYIDGCDCFDETGEEHYRGPHAINMHRCKNIFFEGYTIKNSANWAHALFECENVHVEDIVVLGGHDGVHIHSCTNVTVKNSEFYCGDDCIAGHDNLNVHIKNCIMNTACSGLRFGGTNAMVEDCNFIGPAKYIFRGSLSNEEKRNGKLFCGNHRFNMLGMFTYYSDFTRNIRHTPGNIIIKNCICKNADRFLHYNFSGNEPWQKNKPLENIVFENITAINIKNPITAYGDADVPLRLMLKNCQLSFSDKRDKLPFMYLSHYEMILLENVTVKNFNGDVLIKSWSAGGEIVKNNFVCENFSGIEFEMTNEEFVCESI